MSDQLGIVNKPPYFDDFDSSKNYTKILFRPGRAVQSRELTQIQTTIQNQIGILGDKLLQSPIISGGDFQISKVNFLKFSSSSDPTFLKNKLALVGTSGVVSSFKIVDVKPISDDFGNNWAIFFEYRSGKEITEVAGINPQPILPSQSLSATIIDEAELEQSQFDFSIVGADRSGLAEGMYVYGDALLARLGKGVFYKKGFFVVTDETLTLPLYFLQQSRDVGGQAVTGKYADFDPDTQNTRIGLKLAPSYITTEQDPTLYDPSAGYYNFAAPGADRLQILLSLVQITKDSTEDTIELVDVVDGSTRVIDPTLIKPLDSIQGIYDTDRDCLGGDRILKPFILDIIGSTLNVNSGRAVVNCTDIEIIENQAVSLTKEPDNKRLFNQPFNDQCLSDAVIVQSNGDNPFLAGPTGNDFSVVNTNFFGSGKVRKLFSDEALRLEIVNCDGIKIGCLTLLDIERNDSTSFRLYYNELQTYISTIPTTSLFAEACTLSLDGEKVFSIESSIPLTCSDTTPGGAKRLVYKVPQGTNIKSVFDADYMITRDFVSDITTKTLITDDLTQSPARVAEFNMDIPDGVFNDANTTENLDLFIVSVNGKEIPLKRGTSATPHLRIDSKTKVTVVLDWDYRRATGPDEAPLTIPTAGRCYMIAKVRFPEKSGASPTGSVSSTPIPHRKKRLREARGSYLQNLGTNPSISLGFSDIYKLVSVTDTNGNNITDKFIFDDGQRNDRYDHGSVSLMPGVASAEPDVYNTEKEYIVTFRYFEHEPIAPGFYGPVIVNSYGFDADGNAIANFHGLDLNGNRITLRYDEIPNFLDRISGEVISLADAVDFRLIRTEDGLIENGINRSSIIRGRWFPAPDSSAAVETSYKLDLPRIDLLVLKEDGSFVLLKGESATYPVPPEYPKDGCVVAEINVPGTITSSEDFIIQKPPIKEITLPELNDMQSRIAELEKTLSMQTLENKARVQSAILRNEFLSGMIVDDFGGHYVGDVSNDEYNCSMDFSKGTLRLPFSTKFFDFIPRTGYPKTELEEAQYFVTAPELAGTTFINNDQGTTEISVNPFSSTDWHGYLSLDRPYHLWVDQTTKPIVRNNPRGQNDAWESGGESVQQDGRSKGFGTQWGFWRSLWFGDSLLGNTTFEKDRASAKSFPDDVTNSAPARYVRSIDRDSLFSAGKRTIGNGGFGMTDSKTNRYVDSAISFFSPENYVIVRGYSLKPDTTFSVYFENMNIPVQTSRIMTLTGGALGAVATDSNGKTEFMLYIPNASYITGNKVIKLVENTQTSKPSFASAIYSNNGAAWKELAENDDNSVETEFLPVGRTDVLLQNEKTLYSDEQPLNGIYQRFFIDNNEHPYGIMPHSASVYFSAIDSSVPVSIEIRRINGSVVDSHRIIRNSRVEKTATITGLTEFVFSKPVYLAPGEYALVVRTNSNEYKVHVSQRGLLRVDNAALTSGSDLYATTPFGFNGFYGGSVFSKIEDTSTILRCSLTRKTFSTTQTQTAIAKPRLLPVGGSDTTANFDLLHLSNNNWRSTTGNVVYSIVVPGNERVLSSNTDIPGSDRFDTKTSEIKILVSTTRSDVSPVVDIRKIGLLTVKNGVSKTSDILQNADETGSFAGSNGSKMKYITRRTDLAIPANVVRATFETLVADNFDIRVFAKVLYEGNLDFDSQPYREMQKIQGSTNISKQDFKEMVFELDSSDSPTNFISFCVKVIVTSNSTDASTNTVLFYPEIKNLTIVSSVR
jgi:hypothetical protein